MSVVRRLPKVRIATQLLMWFAVVALVPLVLATSITYRSSEQALTEEVANNLFAIGQRQAHQIERYLRERERSVTALGYSSAMSDAMTRLQAAFDSGGPDAPAYTTQAQEIQRFLAHYNASAGYEDAYFIALQGRVVFAARRHDDLGADLRAPPYRDTELARVFERVLILMSTELSDFSRYGPAGKPVAFIATPLFQHPHLVGVAAFQLSSDEVYRAVNDYTGLGRTGETILASRRGNDAVFITPTRHDPDAAFHRTVPIGSTLGRPIQEAIQARKGSGLAVDYQGRESLAIWTYVPYLRAGMVVKIETAEAFAPVARLRTASIVIAAATLIAAALAAVFVARSLADPIVRLTAMAKSLADGDLTRRIAVPAGNEIGELATSFNDMAGQLAASIELLQETTAARERIESELRVAHDIQMSMVPKTFPAFPDRPEFDIHARIVPAREVGGDFYDFFFIGDDRVFLAIGDVSGKGVPASLFMAVTKTLLKATARKGRGPDEMLARLNHEICQDNDACMFVTIFCGIQDIRTGPLQYCNGGHNPPYVCTREGVRPLLGPNGTALGLVDGALYEAQTMVLAPGDVLFLYTDGVTEAIDKAGDLFTETRLEDCLRRAGRLASADLIRAAVEEVAAFATGTSQSDDLTVLALRYLGCHTGTEGGDAIGVLAAGAIDGSDKDSAHNVTDM
jgi:serine phosphatase RsbU (regulator of sigma subunit)